MVATQGCRLLPQHPQPNQARPWKGAHLPQGLWGCWEKGSDHILTTSGSQGHPRGNPWGCQSPDQVEAALGCGL